MEDLESQIRENEYQKRHLKLSANNSFTLIKTEMNDLKKVPDLSPFWVDKNSTFIPFLPHNNDCGLQDTDEVLQNLNMDVGNLLKQPYHIFWSYMIFDNSLQTFLDTYLRYRIRPYEQNSSNESSSSMLHSIQDAHNLLFRRVFFVLVRASSNREDDIHYMDANYFANIVYEKNIFNIPKMFDICNLYGNSNFKLVRNMLVNLFTLQPKYLEDLEKNIPQLTQLLNNLYQKQIKELEVLKGLEIEKIPKQKIHDFSDLVQYFLDILVNLSSFLCIYPESSCFFLNDSSFIVKIVTFYMELYHLLENNLIGITSSQISQLRTVSLSIVNSIFQYCYLDTLYTPKFLTPINLESRNFSREELAEQLFSHIQSICDKQASSQLENYLLPGQFLYDFEQFYSLQKRLGKLKKMDLNL